MAKEAQKLVANNKKVFHDYFVEEKYEAGLVLHGTEVKSLRMGKCSIKEAFITVDKGEVFINGMHVSPYEKGNIFNKDRSSCFSSCPGMRVSRMPSSSARACTSGQAYAPMCVISPPQYQSQTALTSLLYSCHPPFPSRRGFP